MFGQFFKMRQAVLIVLLSVGCTAPLTGCQSWNKSDASFKKDETFKWTKTVRPADEQIGFFGVSSTARDIESNFGARD